MCSDHVEKGKRALRFPEAKSLKEVRIKGPFFFFLPKSVHVHGVVSLIDVCVRQGLGVYCENKMLTSLSENRSLGAICARVGSCRTGTTSRHHNNRTSRLAKMCLRLTDTYLPPVPPSDIRRDFLVLIS